MYDFELTPSLQDLWRWGVRLAPSSTSTWELRRCRVATTLLRLVWTGAAVPVIQTESPKICKPQIGLLGLDTLKQWRTEDLPGGEDLPDGSCGNQSLFWRSRWCCGISVCQHPHLHPLRSALVKSPKVSPLRPLRLRQHGAVALLPLLEVGEVVPAQCAVQLRLSQGN